jgi:hypothetical protein
MQTRDDKQGDSSEFIDALRKGVLLGFAILLLVIPPLRIAERERERQAQPPVAAAPLRLADFGQEPASEDARLVANWAAYTGDHQNKSFIIIDKKFARVYVFSPDAKLQQSAPALLGEAVGDDSAPGIGSKSLSEILPHEKTTPAGRFVAEPGLNLTGEDVVWIDYDTAVSMHRIRPVKASERRFERLASSTHEDNRISNGCVNLPTAFYESVVSPAVRTTGAIIYVLPETRTPQEVFGSWDVLQRSAPAGSAAMPVAAPVTPAAEAPRQRAARI